MLTTLNTIPDIVSKQRAFFAQGLTKNIDYRIAALKKLKQLILEHQQEIMQALKADLHKPDFEAYFEMSAVKDIDYALKNIGNWVKPKRVKTPLPVFPATAKIYAEPYGVVLIIGPWNYPFSLILSPLVGAIAAGNCAVIKPSEVAENTAKVIAKLINENFDPGFLTVINGDQEVAQHLLAEKFDYIFFTGGTKVGKIVLQAAAQHLTPVTLELGGKSPCIVEPDVNLVETAKRITWGKFINCGQTCIAPDYLLVNRQIKSQLVTQIIDFIAEFYGENPKNSPDYSRIINQRHLARLQTFLQDGEIITGGQIDVHERYFAPTVINKVSLDSPIMQEEIFGPILPVIEYTELSEAIALVNSGPKPLALYLFSQSKEKQQQVINNTSSGGLCINDTVMQVAVDELPFGGVGDSGMGSYHGRASFETFSHQKSVLSRSFLFPLDWRYAPYKDKIEQIKRIVLQK